MYVRGIVCIAVGIYFITNSENLAGRKKKQKGFIEYEKNRDALNSSEKIQTLLSLIERDHNILNYLLAEQNKKIFKELSPYLDFDEIETLQLISEKYDNQFELAAKKENKKNRQKLKKYPLDFKLTEMINIENELDKILEKLEQKSKNNE